VSAGVFNLFRGRATESEYSTANFSVCWGPHEHHYFSNYFIPNFYESLHNKVPVANAG